MLVAARMVSRAADYEMTATTVVGVLGRDDVGAFKALVAEICDEYGVDARVSIHGGSFSVRFTHQTIEPAAPPNQPTGLKSMLARIARCGIQAH